MIRFQFEPDPYNKDTLFLFCGKKNNRIKGLLWEGDESFKVSTQYSNARS